MITKKEFEKKYEYLKSDRYTYLAEDAKAIKTHSIICTDCRYNNIGCIYYEFSPDDPRLVSIIRENKCSVRIEKYKKEV